jgi:hypothetical protein
MVHSVPKLEVTERELRVVKVDVQRVEFRFIDRDVLANLRIEPFECGEEVALVGMI